MLKLKSGCQLWGIFGMKVYVTQKDGQRKCIRRIVKNNQITNQGRTALLELMRPVTYGVLQDERQIWSLSSGTNSTPPQIIDDETTMTEVWQSAFLAPECQVVAVPPVTYYLQVSKIMPTTAAVGSTLVEAGIFTRGDNDDPALAVGRMLYARQIHAPVIKTNVMTIEYNWKLGITIQP